jgi:hypothetical protein
MLFAAVHESAIGTLSPSAVVPTAGQKLKAKRTVLAGHPAVIVSCGPLCFINSLQWPWQVLNPAVECLIVRLRHNHVHIARVVIDKRLPQRRDVGGRRVFCLPFLRSSKTHRLAGFLARHPFPAAIRALFSQPRIVGQIRCLPIDQALGEWDLGRVAKSTPAGRLPQVPRRQTRCTP